MVLFAKARDLLGENLTPAFRNDDVFKCHVLLLEELLWRSSKSVSLPWRRMDVPRFGEQHIPTLSF